MLIALVAAAMVAASMSLAMRLPYAGTSLVLLVPAIPYVFLTVAAILYMLRHGTLAEKLKPRAGDVTFGAVVAAMLFFGALAGRSIFAPHGSAREGWLLRIYVQIGDTEILQRHLVAVSLAVALVAALEEISWRGYVFPKIEEQLGTRRAWPLTAVLYAAAHVPTMFLLSDPFVGPNPLVVLAALGCGLVWGLVVARTGRLPVAIISHVLFTSAVVLHFPLRLGG